MEVHVFSLSGDQIATLKASPADMVADLRAQLSQHTGNSSLHEVRLLLGDACLADDQCWGELQRSADADGPVHLRAIWWYKPAREILFSCCEVAVELAKHYDSLGEQCAESIGSLFLDSEGNPRTQAATFDVLMALHRKLLEVTGLECLKAALAGVALQALCVVEDGSPCAYRFVVGCFVWFGLPAVEALLGRLLSHEIPSHLHEMVRKQLIASFTGHSAQEILSELPENGGEAQMALRSILKTAAEQHRWKEETRLLPPPSSHPEPEPKTRRKPRLSASSSRELLAAIRHGICEELEQVGSFVETRIGASGSTGDANGPAPETTTGYVADTATFTATGDATTDAATGTVTTGTAALAAVLSAVEQEPELVAPLIRGLPLGLAAVESCAGCFSWLQEPLRQEQAVLYTALARNPDLRAEFLITASKSEIHRWRWQTQGSLPQRRKRR